jgi:RNA recognition motif-containing protein
MYIIEATNIFVKLVNEQISEEQLLEAFTKIGAVKSSNISRQRNCAFIEFVSPESCQKALAQHRVQVGSYTVLAEERRYNHPSNQNQNSQRYNSNQNRSSQSFDQRRSNSNSNQNRRNNQSQQNQGGSSNRQNSQAGKGRGAPAVK